MKARRKNSLNQDIRAGWRPIGAQRARKLRRRGEHVEWRPALHSLAWQPEGAPLPDGVVEVRPGEYEAECRGCHEYQPIVCDLSEIPAEDYEHWCGGSPMCCP
ncbi:hypothetical protein [Halomonas salipaludis]|uniref:hypothetical protein n=1 Tax=Halomonas salipaludis TaxID=2032625 RepID=UPI00114095B8|nr:hypothetical protein [Halomonas salipaludis]